MVHLYEAHWSKARVVFRPLYQTAMGLTLVPGPDEATAPVNYESLVQQVELLSGGELTHGSSRRLVDRGWGLYIKNNEALRFPY